MLSQENEGILEPTERSGNVVLTPNGKKVYECSPRIFASILSYCPAYQQLVVQSERLTEGWTLRTRTI